MKNIHGTFGDVIQISGTSGHFKTFYFKNLK